MPRAAPRASCRRPRSASTLPVVEGVGDPQLAVAVGHFPTTPWPGSEGDTIFESHDVSYFTHVDQLHRGDLIKFVTPCATYEYEVTGGQVVAAGTPVYTNPARQTITLLTCWPVDVLYWTNERYMVSGTYVRTLRVGEATRAPTAPAPPAIAAPAPLAAQGLGLATNAVLLGHLYYTGQPDQSWEQGPVPLKDSVQVLATYLAGIRTAEQQQPSWWSALADGAPYSAAAPLHGAAVASYNVPVEQTLVVDHDKITGATVTADVNVTGGSAPGAYSVTVREVVVGGRLRIASWSMARTA